jgi:hypothetical protein
MFLDTMKPDTYYWQVISQERFFIELMSYPSGSCICHT